MSHEENSPFLEKKSEPCIRCGKVTEVIYFFNKKKNNLCEACQAEDRKEVKLNQLREDKKERLDVINALMKIGVNFNGDIYLASHNETISYIQNNLKQMVLKYKKGFYLYGVSGSGKTTNMQLFAHYLIYTPVKNEFRDLSSFLFKTESKIIADIFSSAKDEFDWNFQLAINAYLKNVKFLFIDEFAAKPLTDYELQIVDLLIHHVDEQKKSMRLFITSNKTIEMLSEHYSHKNDHNFADRIVSRMYSLTVPIKLDEKDYRKVN